MSSSAARQSTAKKHDWGLFVCGILVFLMGILVLAWPGLTMITIAMMAGAILIVAGIGNIATYMRMRGSVSGAGWMLANGICDLLLGALFVIYPVATASILPWIAGIFVIFYSAYAIIAGIAMRNLFPSWGLVLATGIVGLLCGIMFVANPSAFVIFLAIFLLIRGVSMAIDGIIAPSYLDYI